MRSSDTVSRTFRDDTASCPKHRQVLDISFIPTANPAYHTYTYRESPCRIQHQNHLLFHFVQVSKQAHNPKALIPISQKQLRISQHEVTRDNPVIPSPHAAYNFPTDSRYDGCKKKGTVSTATNTPVASISTHTPKNRPTQRDPPHNAALHGPIASLSALF